eukprot:2412231-Rhodomonas_salina.1
MYFLSFWSAARPRPRIDLEADSPSRVQKKMGVVVVPGATFTTQSSQGDWVGSTGDRRVAHDYTG